MSATGLGDALRALGVHAAIEARDRLAVLVPLDGATALADPRVRRAAIRIAAEHGFTHLALELVDDVDRAPVPRD